MIDTLSKIIGDIHNDFAVTKEKGTFAIANNAVQVKGKYLAGQYIRIKGSVLNDDIYKISAIDGDALTLEGSLTDEEFTGSIYGLAIPRDFLDLVDEISEWQAKIDNNPRMGIVQSESRQSGSITYATGSDGGALRWQDNFKGRLTKYRRMRYSEQGVKT